MNFKPLERLLSQAVEMQVFPMAQAEVWLEGQRVFSFEVGGATPETLFDLASVTKVMSTTAVYLSLAAEEKVFPHTPIAENTNLTVRDLLTHRSGLPAFFPFFADVLEVFPALFEETCPPSLRVQARDWVLKKVRAITPQLPVGKAAIYSDVGFMVLGEVLSACGEAPLDVLFDTRVAKPLRLSAHYRRLSHPWSTPPPAPTGNLRPRPPAPGQENLWKLSSIPSHDTAVDDDNCFVLDGVSGHAGLFGTASDVARFGQEVLLGLSGKSTLAPKELWAECCQVDVTTPNTTRALGFDTPSLEQSSAGQWMGKIPPGAVGHVGFTGSSLWVDLARHLVVALVSNRTYFGRDNLRIRDFRPKFHDEVVRTFSLESSPSCKTT